MPFATDVQQHDAAETYKLQPPLCQKLHKHGMLPRCLSNIYYSYFTQIQSHWTEVLQDETLCCGCTLPTFWGNL